MQETCFFGKQCSKNDSVIFYVGQPQPRVLLYPLARTACAQVLQFEARFSIIDTRASGGFTG